MPVIPHHANLFQDRKDLYQYLLACQQKSLEKPHPKLVSISLEIDPVDPLAVLHSLNQPDQFHFYFEKKFEGEAIAAFGHALSLEVEGRDRFTEAKTFIQTCLDNRIPSSSQDPMEGTPYFFCGFTFFDQLLVAYPAFPSATIFLPHWQITRQIDRCLITTNLMIHSQADIAALTESTWQQFHALCSTKYSVFHLPHPLPPSLPPRWKITDIHDFSRRVRVALKSIQAGHLAKIVLAHAMDVVSPHPFQWIAALDHLRQFHPDCHVFSMSNGRGQSFIGASPERLISIRDRQLITDALAGSAPRGKTIKEDTQLAHRLLKSEKERYEHQVVVDFMTRQLARLDLTPKLASAPGLRQLSNIQHLHTPIQATLPTALHPLDILATLHPTPAVAGIPRERACDYIRSDEPFERSLYAAPLGWVDAHGNSEFIVGIRSALLEGNRARLYAGAGIVAGSDPEREQAEIQLKLQALLQALV